MISKILHVIKNSILLLSIVSGIVAAPLTQVSAANNGTLKVHELGTASGTESNDPKVCAFNFEGFNFDPAQTGYIMIDTQGGSAPVGVNAGPFSFGPADVNGYAETPYFNVAGGPTIVNGTYKATLYGKDAGGNVNLADEKAKSKVFKVDCTSATPAAVTFADPCFTINDTYTIPSTTGVLYQIAGVTVLAGTYPGSGTVTVTAVADAGYILTGTTSWTYTFTNVPCIQIPNFVVPAAPTMVDLTCVADGSYTIPSTANVIYKVNGVVTPAGIYPVTTAGIITITAEAAPTYVLIGQALWSFTFTQPVGCTPPVVDVCPNLVGVQLVVPVGLAIDQNGNCVVPGMGGGAPVFPVGTPSQPVTPPVVETLVNTGTNTFLTTIVALFLMGSAVAVVATPTRPNRS